MARIEAEIKEYERKVAGGLAFLDAHKIEKPKWTKPSFHTIPNNSITPYPGVMSEVVAETLRIANKPQPELSILSALVGMASAIGGNYKMPGGGRFNLYGIGISGTGSGKDKAMLAGVKLARSGGSELGGAPGSGAALEDMLSERGTKILLNMDEVAHFVMSMNDSKQTHMATLGGYLLKLFSASRGFYHTRRLANSSHNEQRECITPCVSMLGFACPEKLGAAFGNSTNIEDGLIGRILFCNGLDNVRPRRDQGEFLLPGHAIDKGKMISCNHEIVLGIDKDADDKLDELLQEFDVSSEKSSSIFAKSMKTRSYEKCERVAGVLAIWDNPHHPVISLSHVLWAADFIRHSDNAIIKFTNKHLHGGQVQADAMKILDIIARLKNGELKRKEEHVFIYANDLIPRSALLHHSHLAKKDFDSSIDQLIDLERVSCVNLESSGRQVKCIKTH